MRKWRILIDAETCCRREEWCRRGFCMTFPISMTYPTLRCLIGCVMPLAFTLLSAINVAFAQADRGTIEGIVTETSGASIAGADVKILRVETNDVISLRTNDLGRFYAP